MPRNYIRAINGETMNLSAPDKSIPTGSLQISNEWLATKRTNVNFLLEIVLCILSCSLFMDVFHIGTHTWMRD